jgi:hypothetical protein
MKLTPFFLACTLFAADLAQEGQRWWSHIAGVVVQVDKEPDRNLFIRSDPCSFIKQGVPALAFKFGYADGSPEETTAKNWLKNRYHAPSDDLDQPVDKAAAAQFNRILLDLATRVANAEDRPKWNDHSFSRRFAEAGNWYIVQKVHA